MKHTDGPWKATGRDIQDSCGNAVAMVSLHAKSEQERDANAILIATAPELLEALKYAASCLKTDGNDPIDKVIAKAEGRI